jgi:putative ABC transport system ATP-binding protein
MIVLQNVTKEFGSEKKTIKAANNISLTIEAGQYVAIIGKSGSGKSTLLNMITGIDHPTEGVVLLNGKNIRDLNESDLAKWRGENVGIVFQFFQLIPTITIFENILLAMEFVNVIPKQEREKRAMHLLELVDIFDQANKMPSTLSGGQQQRAAIARALANNPKIIVADEPTGNLDSKTAQDINGLFLKLVKQGKTVVVVTHDSSAIEMYNRVITISDGSIN